MNEPTKEQLIEAYKTLKGIAELMSEEPSETNIYEYQDHDEIWEGRFSDGWDFGQWYIIEKARSVLGYS